MSLSEGLARGIGKVIGTAEFLVKDLAPVIGEKALTLSPFGCGYTVTGHPVHDHWSGYVEKSPTGKYVGYGSLRVPYDQKTHGRIDPSTWIKERQRMPKSFQDNEKGETPIHRHPEPFTSNTLNASGPIEFQYEQPGQ